MAKERKVLRFKEASKDDAVRPAALRVASRSLAPMVLTASLIAGFSLEGRADPQANHVYSKCTFTTSALQGALNIDPVDLPNLNGGQIAASYIIVYVRQNPNNGQAVTGGADAGGYTGPILCTNADTDEAVSTTEGTAISASIDILGAEESSHIQIQPHGSMDTNQRQKRVCHTVASNTDCFLIQASPGD